MKKELYQIEISNIVAWFNDFKNEKIKDLKIKDQWTLLSNVKKMQPAVQEFEEFRDKLIADLNNEYFGNDEKSEATQIPRTDDDGNNVIGPDGEVEMQEGRKVKEEYFEEYQEKVSEINGELQKLMVEKTEYEFKGIDLDELVEGLSEDTKIELEDVDMLSFCAVEGE